MTKCIFITQQTLSTWLEQDQASFSDNLLTIRSDGRQFRLEEAVRFIRIEEGPDASGLVGKVKTLEQLTAMKAERYCDSVIFQDAAYKVQEGFIGEVMPKEPEPILLEVRKSTTPKAMEQPLPSSLADAPTEKPVSPPSPDKDENTACESDEELLTKFLLKNL